MTGPFPRSPTFMTIDEPFRFEGELFDLEIEGKLPAELDGTFYRIGPDQQFPPMRGDSNPFNGDGIVTAFRFRAGHVDMQHRYVQTERFKAERKARRGLFGDYRNPFTDDPSVRGVQRTVSNTNVVAHQGQLLTLKEDGPPYALDPATLATKQLWDWNGQMTATTFTAHPKIDTKSGDLVGYSYAAKGEASLDCAFWTFDKSGKKTREIWFKSPQPSMIHDCGLTENFLVLVLIPQLMDLERIRRGGILFQWEPKADQIYAVIRRDGGPGDVRFFRAPNGFPGHTINAFEEKGKVYLDLPVVNDNVFWFFPDAQGQAPRPETFRTEIVRWCFDMSSKSDKPTAQVISHFPGEFPHVDDRYVGRPYRHAFMQGTDPTKPYDGAKAGPIMGFFFNTFMHLDMTTGQEQTWFVGDTSSTQEPVFVPKSAKAAEGEGYLLGVVNRRAEHRSDLLVFDAQQVDQGPIATVKIPVRLKYGIHGNWVPAARVRPATSSSA